MPLKHLSLAKFPPIDMFTFSPWCLSVAVQDMNRFLPLCCFIQVKMSELLNKLRYRNIYLQEKATTHSGRQIQKRQRGCRSFHNFAPFSRCEIKGHLAKKPDSQEKIYWGNTYEHTQLTPIKLHHLRNYFLSHWNQHLAVSVYGINI